MGYMSVCVSCQHTISQAHAHIYIQLPPFFFTSKRTWAFPHHTPHRKFGRFGLQGLEPGEHLFRAVLPGLPVFLILIPDQPDFTEEHKHIRHTNTGVHKKVQ